MIDIKVPTVGESITEVTLVKWVKKNGDYVERDEVIAELESEKATIEVNAEKAGILKTKTGEGDTINIEDIIAQIDESSEKKSNGLPAAAAAGPVSTQASQPQPAAATTTPAPQAVATGKGKIDMKIPTVGESITEVTLVKWVKGEGDL